jgi:hypothetical protein
MNDSPGSLNGLIERIEELERRVSLLERTAPEVIHGPAAPALKAAIEMASEPESRSAQASGVFSVLGKSMLGIAGAYLLRALAESGSLPRLTIASVAVAYAMMWLFWAARTPAKAWFASTAYACTSALILAPMLWELTLRFNMMPAPAAAAILAVFVCAAFWLAWKRDLPAVLWAANVAAAVVAAALSIATGEMVPFIAMLLLMVLLSEIAAARGHGSGIRPLAALAADGLVWAFTYIYSGPQNAREQYRPLGASVLVAPGFTLFVIVAAFTIFKIMGSRKTISIFETIQTIVGFSLAAAGLLYFGPPAGPRTLGIFCLVLCGAGFVALVSRLDPIAERRNSIVVGAWSTALLLAGAWLCLPRTVMSIVLAVAAVASTLVANRKARPAFAFYGVVFLLAGAGVSGMAEFAFDVLAGAPSGPPSAIIFLLSACAVCCYAVSRPGYIRTGTADSTHDWRQEVLPALFASVAAAALAALLIEGLLTLVALKMSVEHQHLAFIRTFIICGVAIGLAFAGSRGRRPDLTRRSELTWIGYAALFLVAVKLIFEDLRHGHLEYTAASIFLFALTLIVLPRVSRMKQRA